MKILLLILFVVAPLNLWASQLPSGFGFSGMAQLNDFTYIVVQDKKAYEEGTRLAAIRIQSDGNYKFSKILIQDWKHEDGQSNDLESICSIPGHSSEFLVAESSYRKKKYGRIFHLKIKNNQAEIIKVYQLPIRFSKKGRQKKENFEGLVCFDRQYNILVILGKRGGSKTNKQGGLRFGVFDYRNFKIDWSIYSDQSFPVSAPGAWHSSRSKRDISDLYLDKNRNLWAVATDDPGDVGPFRSIIYKIGKIQYQSRQPFKPKRSYKASWIIDGFKVEALSGPSKIVEGSVISFGTEDENYTGNWRSLYPSLK